MKILNRLFIASLAFASLLSCNMSLNPTDSISTENAFESVSDAEKFATGLNVYYRGLKYGGFCTNEEIQSDFYNAANGYGNNGGSLHQMHEYLQNNDRDIEGIFNSPYLGLLKNANVLINGIDKITTDKEAEQLKLKEFKGIALFYRADAHFDLARRFTVPYTTDADAKKNDGIPYVKAYDPIAKPSRGTQFDTYQAILADLDEAAVDLAGVQGKAGAETPTIDAVKALKARVLLTIGLNAEAAALADEVIKAGTYSLATTKEDMESEWINDSGKECIFQIYTDIKEGVNTNTIYLGYNKTNKTYKPLFIPTKTVVEGYEATDLRKAVWFQNLPVDLPTGKFKLDLLTKFQGNPLYDVADDKSYKHKPKVLRLGILYLIHAEASFKAGDLGAAKASLNALQTARKATLTEATMDAIQTEWARETIGEGYRIDCLRRWGLGFTGRVPQNDATIESGPYFESISVESGYYQFTWPIPKEQIDLNQNLKQNPRW